MTAEQWAKVESLFHRAVAVQASQRSPLLDLECGSDPVVRRETEALLAAHDRDNANLATGGAVSLSGSASLVFSPGEVIGHYQIVRHIDSGGMGDVYEARDTRLDRRVAIKVLPELYFAHPELVETESRERFRREGRLLAALNHPNILTIYDLGEAAGHPFLVTEFIEGRTLRERLAEGPLDQSSALAIARQIASALAASHRLGIVHRDIKPGNIMLRDDGVVRVLDFGLARQRATEAQRHLTQSGTVVGTLQYMSPEQLAGEEADARSDLWSLGVVLSEMIHGRAPAGGHTGNGASAAARSSPLGRLLSRAMERHPDARFQSADEFIRSIDNVLGGRDGAHRKLRYAEMAALIVAAVIATVMWAFWPRDNGGKDTLQFAGMSYLTRNGRVGWMSVSPDGSALAYTVRNPGTESLRVRQIATGSEIELLAPARLRFQGLTFSPDASYVYYVAYGDSNIGVLSRIPLMGGEPRRVAEDVDSPIAFSPAGDRYAFIRNAAAGHTGLVIRELSGSERVLVDKAGSESFVRAGLSWSPDGASIAAVVREASSDGRSAYRPVLIGVLDGAMRPIAAGPWTWAGRITWMPDGRRLAVSAADRVMNVRALAISIDGNPPTVLTTDVSNYFDAAVPRSGDIALIRDEVVSRIETLHPDKPAVLQQIAPPSGRYRGLNWSGENSLLTVLPAGDRLQVWEFSPSGQKQVTEDPSDKQDPHPCGATALVYSARSSGEWKLWTSDRDGGNARQLTSGPGDDRNPQCTADGSAVYFESLRGGQQSIWRVDTASRSAAQIVPGISRSLAVAPRGDRLACELSIDSRWRRAVVRLSDHTAERYIDGIPAGAPVRWHPSGAALSFVDTRGEASNVWLAHLDGRRQRQVTFFEHDQIFHHDWSSLSGRLALVRGSANNDVVLLKRAR